MSQLRLAVPILSLITAVLALRGDAVKQPVFFFLHTSISDYVNTQISLDRLNRLLTKLDKYSSGHEQEYVSATVLFSGEFSREAPNPVRTQVMKYVDRRLIETGYDGSDEPTYTSRFVPDTAGARSWRERWQMESDSAGHFLTMARDPLYGEPEPDKAGGLKAEQETFGPAALVTGYRRQQPGADSQFVHQIQRLNRHAMLWGVPPANKALYHVAGFGGAGRLFGGMMSPEPDAPPELFWQDYRLRTSDSSDGVAPVFAYEGVEPLQKILGKLDRSRIHIIHIQVADERSYLQPDFLKPEVYPPLHYAFDHPEHQLLPKEALRSGAEIEAASARESALLDYLVNDFIPKNQGSRFVTPTAVEAMTPPAAGYSVTTADFKDASAEYLKQWALNLPPPTYMVVKGRYLALSDIFVLALRSIALTKMRHKEPDFVGNTEVFGPVEATLEHGPNVGSVSKEAVEEVCAKMYPQFEDRPWQASPENFIPTWVEVGGQRVNASQFLHLMLETVAGDASPEIPLKMRSFLSAAGVGFPSVLSWRYMGESWTLKPAPLSLRVGESRGGAE